MSACTKSSLPLDDLPNWISFSLHGPYHGEPSFMRGDMFRRNDLPMATVDLVVEFLVHCIKKHSAVWLAKSISEGHGVWVSGDVGKYV